MKKLILILLLLLPLQSFAVFTTPFAATSTTQGWIFPLKINGIEQTIVGTNFIATSTTASVFPYASSTTFSATSLCLTGDLPCKTTWPTGGSGSLFPFTPTTNFNQVANATTTQIWLQGSPISLSASTTAVFNSATTSLLSVTGDTIYGTTNTDRFVWMGNGTKYSPEAINLGTDTTGNYADGNGEAGSAIGLVCTDCVTLGTETTGNYAGGTAEAGSALAGDSATLFFPSGTLETTIGGTGATSYSIANTLLYWDGTKFVATSTNPLYVDRITATSSIASIFPYASTTALSADVLCLTGDLPCKTTWPISGSGVGTVSTSTTPTRGNLSYWTSSGSYPETLGTVATTSLTASSPLSLSQPISVIGGSASALSLSTAGDWTGTLDGIDGTAIVQTSRTLTVAGTANQITSSAGAQDLSANRTWTLSVPSQFNIQQASTTLLSVLGPLYVGGTATTSIVGNLGTSTFSSFLSAVSASTTATSTMAGINLPYGGCFAVNGTCIGGGGGSGTVTSVAMTVPSFLSVSGSPITTSGTLAVTLSGTALSVASGGTGQTSFGQGWLNSNGTTISASTSPTVNYIFATSTTVASSFQNFTGINSTTTNATSTASFSSPLITAGSNTGRIYSDGTNQIVITAPTKTTVGTDGNITLGTTTTRYAIYPQTDLMMDAGVAANRFNNILAGGSLGIGTTSPFASTSISSFPGNNIPIFEVATSTGKPVFDVMGNGHIRINGAVPSIGTPATCGTSPSSSVTAGSSDVAGKFTITTGSVAPTLCTTTITLASGGTRAPTAVMLQLASLTALTLDAYVKSSTASTIVVEFGGTPAASTAYSFYYWVIE